MITGKVGGKAQLRDVQADLTLKAPQQLRADIKASTREALKGIEPDVKEEASLTLPRRGGYAAVIVRTLQATSRVSGTDTVKATVKVFARGRVNSRDLTALNRGELRHPDIRDQGKPRRDWRWHGQAVRPGMVSRPIDRAQERVVAGVQEAADRFADTIARG